MRDLRRGPYLPVPGDRLVPGNPGRHDPARDGAHVVRRPGHHGVVGRPLAERVVRQLGERRRARRGNPVYPGLDDIHAGFEGVGLPAGPADVEATRFTQAWTKFTQSLKGWAYRQDQLPSTHPIAADIPDIAAVEVNFHGITYAKGAAVLKQLVAYVGRDNFLAGVRRYFDQHAFGNATLADLLAALEESSGRDLSTWSKQWLETAGVNTLRPEIQVGDDGAITEFAVLQEAPATHPVLRAHRIAVGLYDRTQAGLIRRRQVEADVSGDRSVLADLAGEGRPDLVLINDDDLTYAKTRLDEH